MLVEDAPRPNIKTTSTRVDLIKHQVMKYAISFIVSLTIGELFGALAPVNPIVWVFLIIICLLVVGFAVEHFEELRGIGAVCVLGLIAPGIKEIICYFAWI